MSPSPQPGEHRVRISMTPQEAREFVEKLATDDEFRSRLEDETLETLAEYHVVIPEEMLPDEVVLPSKEEAQRALESLDQAQELRLYPSGFIAPFLGFPHFIFLRREETPE